MAAISLSLKRGVDGFNISDFTVGTSPPGANDYEFRYNTTDSNGKTIPSKDIITALKGIMRAIEQGGATVNVITKLGI